MHRCVQTACRMDLFTKAAELGIQTEFVDGQGHRHVTDAAALEIILNALPVRAPHRFLNRPIVVRSGRDTRTKLGETVTFPLQWKIVADLKVIAQGETSNRIIKWTSDLPIGSETRHSIYAEP